ncbi:hypothetical protein DFJ77DRAFT_480602 [Powellomyces hirtus]|nr:hypothetical protein DFJ77DRAFT_480602 [Powellomyces hirtus]
MSPLAIFVFLIGDLPRFLQSVHNSWFLSTAMRTRSSRRTRTLGKLPCRSLIAIAKSNLACDGLSLIYHLP